MAAGAFRTATPSTLFFEDLRIGQTASLVRTMRSDDVHLFAQVEGEIDASHGADGFACDMKFGQRIAPGLFTSSLVAAIIGTRLPGPRAVYLSQTIQFLAPVRIGDVVTATVEVVDLVPARRRVRLFCACVRDGRPVLEGEAWVAVESRAARAGSEDRASA